MNVWKPIALVLAAGFVGSIAIQAAHAGGAPPQTLPATTCGSKQPNMVAAYTAISTANSSLNAADQDKQGYRAKALADVLQAANDINSGCTAAK